jgi:hypothetical protein
MLTPAVRRRLSRRRPSPALVISLLALFVALGGTTYAASGDPFLLGNANTATSQTSLSASLADRAAFKVTNPGSGLAGAFVRTSSTGTHTALSATSASTAEEATAMHATMSSASSGFGSAAMSGLNNGQRGYGVMGESAGFGTGVAGFASGGTGVAGFGGNEDGAIGVSGTASQGTGLLGAGDTGVLGTGASTGVTGTLGENCVVFKAAVKACGGSSGVGLFAHSSSAAVEGDVANGICIGGFAVGGCAGETDFADGVFGESGSNGAAMRAWNDNGGNIFVGESGPSETVKVRIDSNGKGFFDGGFQAGGADYAEAIRTSGRETLRRGDVLTVASGGQGVTRSSRAYSTRVVGVYSTKPALLAGANAGSLRGKVPVAMLGIVPTKVTAANGAIRPGDLLTTSNIPGYAMKAKPLVVRGVAVYPTGALLGKALEPLAHGSGMIKVLVMLR